MDQKSDLSALKRKFLILIQVYYLKLVLKLVKLVDIPLSSNSIFLTLPHQGQKFKNSNILISSWKLKNMFFLYRIKFKIQFWNKVTKG